MSLTSPSTPGEATYHPKTSKNSTPSEIVKGTNHGTTSPTLPSSAPDRKPDRGSPPTSPAASWAMLKRTEDARFAKLAAVAKRLGAEQDERSAKFTADQDDRFARLERTLQEQQDEMVAAVKAMFKQLAQDERAEEAKRRAEEEEKRTRREAEESARENERAARKAEQDERSAKFAAEVKKTRETIERISKSIERISAGVDTAFEKAGRKPQKRPDGGNVTKIPPPPPAGPTKGENATKMGGFDTDAAPPSPPANERAERPAALLPTPTDDTSGGVTVDASRGATTGDEEAIHRVGDFASTVATTLDDELAAFHEEAESLGGNNGEDGAEDAETSPPATAAGEGAGPAPTDAERTDTPPASDPPWPPRRTITGGVTTGCGGVAVQVTAPALAPTAAPPAAAPTAAPPAAPTAAPTAAQPAVPTAAPTAAPPAAPTAAPTAVLSAPPAIPPSPPRNYYSGGVTTTAGGFVLASGGVDVPVSGFIPVLEGARELPKQSGAKDSGGTSPGPRSTPQSRDSCRPEGRHRKPPDPGPPSRMPFRLMQEKAGRQQNAATTNNEKENTMPRRRVEWGLAPSWAYGSDDDDPVQKAASGSCLPSPDLRGSAPMRVLHVRAGLDEYERDPPWEGPIPDVGDGGYNDGYDGGYETDIVGEEFDGGYFGGDGQNIGYGDGNTDGYDDEDNGYNDGSYDGYDDGYNYGYDDGYNYGYDNGYYSGGYESEISDDGQSYYD